jgi:AbrB family looped-hinge helix DNA binding protein
MSKAQRSWDIPVASGGRIVIPSEVRQELAMRDGQRIRLQLRDGILEIVPFSTVLSDIQRRWAVSANSEPTEPPLSDRQANAAEDQP